MGKRASYRHGIAWIASEDEPGDLDVESIKFYISTGLLADLFGKDAEDVARAIRRKRLQWIREEKRQSA